MACHSSVLEFLHISVLFILLTEQSDHRQAVRPQLICSNTDCSLLTVSFNFNNKTFELKNVLIDSSPTSSKNSKNNLSSSCLYGYKEGETSLTVNRCKGTVEGSISHNGIKYRLTYDQNSEHMLEIESNTTYDKKETRTYDIDFTRQLNLGYEISIMAVADTSLVGYFQDDGELDRFVVDVYRRVNYTFWKSLGIQVTLSGLLKWKHQDMFDLSRYAEPVLDDFAEYQHIARQALGKCYVASSLMINHRMRSEHGYLVGVAFKNGLCNQELSAILVTTASSDPNQISETVVHELGHLLGVGHYEDYGCKCPQEEDCFMRTAYGHLPARRWSDCVIKRFKEINKSGFNVCSKKHDRLGCNLLFDDSAGSMVLVATANALLTIGIFVLIL